MRSYFEHPLKYLFGCFSPDFYLLENLQLPKDDTTAFAEDTKNLIKDSLSICSYFSSIYDYLPKVKKSKIKK